MYGIIIPVFGLINICLSSSLYTKSGITYNVLSYYEDDDNDYKYITKFIKGHEYCKVIKINDYYKTEDGEFYHPYYNPGTLISKTIYYVNGNMLKCKIE